MQRWRPRFTCKGHLRHIYRPKQQQWKHKQFRHHAYFWRHRGRWTPLWPSDQQSGTFRCTHKGNKQLMTMSGGWRRIASRGIGLHRMGTTNSLSHTQGTTDFTPKHPSIKCHEYDKYGHIIMDCSHRIATPDQALDTTRKTKKEGRDIDHILDTANIITSAIVTCTEATPDDNNGTGTATKEAAQDNPSQHTVDTVTGPPWHTTLVTLQTSTHHSSPGYNSQDHSRLHSWPPYLSSKYGSNQKGSCISGSYFSQGTTNPIKAGITRSR